MGLAAQWNAMAARISPGWHEVAVLLRLAREADTARAAALLGALSPGLTDDGLQLRITPRGAQGPGALRRALGRLDHDGIAGTLELLSEQAAAEAPAGGEEILAHSLAGAWDELVARLPDDWSDLLCLVELQSSDDLGPAALDLAPLNPSRHDGLLALRFRVARRFGYGAAPEMARRCLERLDEAGMPGTLRLLEAFSDTRPVLTQGPTFAVGGRAV